MKKFKSTLVTLSLILALGGVLSPLQTVRADDGNSGPQGGSDSQSRKAQAAKEEAARALLLLLASYIL